MAAKTEIGIVKELEEEKAVGKLKILLKRVGISVGQPMSFSIFQYMKVREYRFRISGI